MSEGFEMMCEKRAQGSTKRTHAFFVWERGHAPAAITGHIFKSEI